MLTLEGCPLMQLPNARARVIEALPQLRCLDGRAIAAAERGRAAATVRAEAACLSVMLQNACLAHKLAHVARLLRVHAELQCALFGPSSAVVRSALPSSEVDALKLLRLWDYERDLGEQVGGGGRAWGQQASSTCQTWQRKPDLQPPAWSEDPVQQSRTDHELLPPTIWSLGARHDPRRPAAGGLPSARTAAHSGCGRCEAQRRPGSQRFGQLGCGLQPGGPCGVASAVLPCPLVISWEGTVWALATACY